VNARHGDAPDDRTGQTDDWALTAQLPPEPGQPTPTLAIGRVLAPDEYAEVKGANALLRRLTGGSAYQRLHQAFRLLDQHAQRARTRAARVPQPSLGPEVARIDRAVVVTLTAADELLGHLVDDVVADYGQDSSQATTMREAIDEAQGRLPVALLGPLLALANRGPSLVEMWAPPSDPADGEAGADSGEPSWEPVLRESVVSSLVAAVAPAAALAEAPIVVPLLRQLVLACERLFAQHLLLREERIVAASLRLRRLAAEVLDGTPTLTSTSGDPPPIRFTELALGEVGVLQRALRRARRMLSPPVTQATSPSTASPEGPATTARPTPEAEEKPAGRPPTGEGAATSAPEAEGTGTAAAVDLVAVVEHVSRLTGSVERAWSAALDPEALGEANREILDQWHSLVAVVQRQAVLSSRALAAAGLDATVDQYPLGPPQLLALDLDPDVEQRRRQLQVAQFYALEQLLAALEGLRHPTRAALDLGTGQVTETWWDSGAFALVRTRARHLARVTLTLLDAERAAIAAATDTATAAEQAEPRAETPSWLAYLQLGTEALRRGDAEAALLHAHLSLTARFAAASLTDTVAASFGNEAEGEVAKALVAKLEGAIGRLAAGGVDLGISVPLAHALLPLAERLLLPAPASNPPAPEAEAGADQGPTTSQDQPSDTDPNESQAGT
jgi:hypothetical protein